MEQIVSKNIRLALEYGEKLVGKPYGLWQIGKNMIQSDHVYWAFDKPAPPSKVESASCGGFINLLRRTVGLNIPGRKSI